MDRETELIGLDRVCRVLDTGPVAPDSLIAVRIAGVKDLLEGQIKVPETVRAVLYTAFIVTDQAAAEVELVALDPKNDQAQSVVAGPTTQSTSGGKFARSGAGLLQRLDDRGQICYRYSGKGPASRVIIDVWGYIINQS